MNPGWTDERVQKMKELWAAGESAAQIARGLGGVTRNAVLGKLSRAGLLNIGAGRQTRSAAPRVPRAPRFIEPSLPKAPPAPPMGDELTEFSRSPEDAVKGTCRWGIGDPREGSFRFCGMIGFPYCPGHARRAYQPPKPNERKPR